MVFKIMLLPALTLQKDYGDCPEEEKDSFLYGIKLFIEFLTCKLFSTIFILFYEIVFFNPILIILSYQGRRRYNF